MRTLHVFLGETRAGTISLLPGELTLFSFAEEYLADPHAPVLSQSYFTTEGYLRAGTRPTKTRLPPWFSNLLPEGRLREYLAELGRINPRREFDLLRLLGADLPGAVRVLEEGEKIPAEGTPGTGKRSRSRGPLRFSLAGVQLKFSAVLGRDGGLTIPASGMGGEWIVKLPSLSYASVPENEDAMLTLAEAVGLPVPEHRLVPMNEIHGLPDLGPLAGQKALAVRRFDRGPAGRIHMEDLAQVFGHFPEDKYGKVGFARIAEMVSQELGSAAAQDFVARLAFVVLTGNGDMHLKNWSLLYPDGKTPCLAPAYDLVSTVTYLPHDRLALNFAGEKEFARVTMELFSKLAQKAALSERETLSTVSRVTEAVIAAWPRVRRDSEMPPEIAERIEAHLLRLPLLRKT